MDYFKRLKESSEVSPFINVMYKWSLAEYHWFMADSEECLRQVLEGLKECEASGFHLFEHLLFAQGAHGALTAGNLSLAHEYLEKMRAVLSGIRRFDISNYHYLSTWYFLLQGDMTSARHYAQNALSIAIEVGMPFHRSLCHLGMSQAFFELGDYAEAQEHIQQAIAIARQKSGPGLEVFACFFRPTLS